MSRQAVHGLATPCNAQMAAAETPSSEPGWPRRVPPRDSSWSIWWGSISESSPYCSEVLGE